MKVESTKNTVVKREEKNLKTTEDVRNGQKQFHFMSELNPKIKTQLTWFDSVVKQWNEKSIEEATSYNRMNHAAAFALQRDANYCYSDRKRLMCMGHDSRFESSYQEQVRAYLATNIKD